MLQPGWTAIQLRVQPPENGCADLFTGLPVESVHWWRRETVSEAFDLDPDRLFPRQADWEAWYADDPDLSTFSRLLAGETYLVQLADGAGPLSLPVTGRVVLNPIAWLPGELNLVGLPADTDTSLGQFFYFTSEITVNSSTATVFRVGSNGQPQRVFQPWTTPVVTGEAYWVLTGADLVEYEGPVRVTTDSGARLLDFGASVMPRTLRLHNDTDAVRTVRLAHLPSTDPPPGVGFPARLGRPNLVYRTDAVTGDYAPLPDVLTLNIPAGETLDLRLAADAAGMAETIDPGGAWQGILEITDGGNAEFADTTVRHRIGVVCNGAIGALADPAGLWIGEAVVSGVNRAPTRPDTLPFWDSDTPQPVADPFRFRLILHVDADGTVRLLQRVLTAWRPLEEGGAEAGAVALLADETAAAAYQLAHPGARIDRIGTVNLPPMPPLTLDGAFGGANVLTGTILLPFDDPVNPFVHRFHPDHDNLDVRNDVAYPREEGVESWTVTRDWTLTFAPLDPEQGAANRLWGVAEVGGVFTERIEGLNKTLRVGGTFRLRRMSDHPVLLLE